MVLFTEEIDKEKETKYIEFLKERGYVIIPPSYLDCTSITTIPSLINYFYSMLQYYHQDRKLHYYKSTKRDSKVVKNFINSRIEAGAGNRKKAIQECVEIIKCVIENESEFSFSEPLHSLDCFGQDNMKWVTDKAISIINKENERVNKKEMNIFIDNLTKEQEKEALNSFEGNVGELNRILGGL